MQLYFQDKKSDVGEWQGFLLSCSDAPKPLLRLQTTQNRCMKLTLGKQALFWAQIEEDHYGVDMLRTLPTSEQVNLMPPIKSADLVQASQFQGQIKQQFWAKFFVNCLQNSVNSPLQNGLWTFDFCQLGHSYNQPAWLGRNHKAWCAAKDEDVKFLAANDIYIDWAVCGNGNIINLFAPHQNPSQVGRIKWWCKVAKEQALPPLLVWYISGIDSYVLLDGHDRLQAALITGIAPTCLVLSSYTEHASFMDEDKQAAILHQLAIIEKKMAEGTYVSEGTMEGINSALVGVFDNRPTKRFVTKAVADLTLALWQKETKAFRTSLKRGNPKAEIEQYHLHE